MKKLNLPPKKCIQCKKFFSRDKFKNVSDFKVQKFCSKKCYTKFNRGEHHWNWKGGVRLNPEGYLRTTDDRFVHRIVMEKHLGRKLKRSEQVHHIDGDRANNDIVNLKVFSTNSAHRKFEVKNQKRNKYGQFTK